MVWDAVQLDRVDVVSTLYRWNADPDAPTEVPVDAATLLDLSRGQGGFDAGRFALSTGPIARINAFASTDASSDLFAEHIQVTMVHVGPNRMPVTSQHWRYFSVDRAGTVTELSSAAWNERVDPVEVTVDAEGRIERTQRGYSVVLTGPQPVVGDLVRVPEE